MKKPFAMAENKIYVSIVPYFSAFHDMKLGSIGILVGSAGEPQEIERFCISFLPYTNFGEQKHALPLSATMKSEQEKITQMVLHQQAFSVEQAWKELSKTVQLLQKRYEQEQHRHLVWLWGDTWYQWTCLFMKWQQESPDTLHLIMPILQHQCIQTPWDQWSRLYKSEQTRISTTLGPVSGFPCEAARRLYRLQLALDELEQPSWWSLRGLARKWELWFYS